MNGFSSDVVYVYTENRRRVSELPQLVFVDVEQGWGGIFEDHGLAWYACDVGWISDRSRNAPTTSLTTSRIYAEVFWAILVVADPRLNGFQD